MAFCPECGFEYPRELESCPDCGEELIAELPQAFAPAMSPDDSWVLVGGVTSEVKVNVAKGSLNSNNIPSVFLPSKLDAETQLELANIDAALTDTKANLILVPKEFGSAAILILRSVLGDELIQPVTDNPLI